MTTSGHRHPQTVPRHAASEPARQSRIRLETPVPIHHHPTGCCTTCLETTCEEKPDKRNTQASDGEPARLSTGFRFCDLCEMICMMAGEPRLASLDHDADQRLGPGGANEYPSVVSKLLLYGVHLFP